MVKQDWAYSIEVLLKLLEMYEAEYQEKGVSMSHDSLSTCMFLLVSSLGGMCGFEVTWTDLSGLLYDLAYCKEREDYSAISWPVVGRFKCEGGVAGCYMIPIAGQEMTE